MTWLNFLSSRFIILILVIAVVIPMMMGVPKNEKMVSWLSLKMKMARLLTIVKGNGYMLNSEASGMTTLMQITLLITGPL
jgi:hypothetical protein